MHIDSLVLKADMHLHTHEDPVDRDKIKHSAFELIDYLEKKDFNVFSITLHDHMYDEDMMLKVRAYAKSKGMLYIPGIEKTIEDNHILIYNMRKEDAEKIDTYRALKKTILDYGIKSIKERDNLLIIASHPFFPGKSAIGERFYAKHDLLHGVEYNAFYLDKINFNNEGYRAAKRRNKVTIGNTDAHDLERINNTFTKIFVDAYQFVFDGKVHNAEDFKEYVKGCSEEKYDFLNRIVINSIKRGRVKIVTKPLKAGYVLKSLFKIFK